MISDFFMLRARDIYAMAASQKATRGGYYALIISRLHPQQQTILLSHSANIVGGVTHCVLSSAEGG